MANRRQEEAMRDVKLSEPEVMMPRFFPKATISSIQPQEPNPNSSITLTTLPNSPQPPDPPDFIRSRQKSSINKVRPLKYSCDEIYERMQHGFCIFCEEQDTPGHQELKHKGYKIIIKDCFEHQLCDDKGLVTPAIETSIVPLLAKGEETPLLVNGFKVAAFNTDLSIQEMEPSGAKDVIVTDSIQKEEPVSDLEQMGSNMFHYHADMLLDELQLGNSVDPLFIPKELIHAKDMVVLSQTLTCMLCICESKNEIGGSRQANYVWKPGSLWSVQVQWGCLGRVRSTGGVLNSVNAEFNVHVFSCVKEEEKLEYIDVDAKKKNRSFIEVDNIILALAMEKGVVGKANPKLDEVTSRSSIEWKSLEKIHKLDKVMNITQMFHQLDSQEIINLDMEFQEKIVSDVLGLLFEMSPYPQMSNRVWEPGGLQAQWDWLNRGNSTSTVLKLAYKFPRMVLQEIISIQRKFQEEIVADVLSLLGCLGVHVTKLEVCHNTKKQTYHHLKHKEFSVLLMSSCSRGLIYHDYDLLGMIFVEFVRCKRYGKELLELLFAGENVQLKLFYDEGKSKLKNISCKMKMRQTSGDMRLCILGDKKLLVAGLKMQTSDYLILDTNFIDCHTHLKKVLAAMEGLSQGNVVKGEHWLVMGSTLLLDYWIDWREPIQRDEARVNISTVPYSYTNLINDLRYLVKSYLVFMIIYECVFKRATIIEFTVEYFEYHLASVLTYAVHHSPRPPELCRNSFWRHLIVLLALTLNLTAVSIHIFILELVKFQNLSSITSAILEDDESDFHGELRLRIVLGNLVRKQLTWYKLLWIRRIFMRVYEEDSWLFMKLIPQDEMLLRERCLLVPTFDLFDGLKATLVAAIKKSVGCHKIYVTIVLLQWKEHPPDEKLHGSFIRISSANTLTFSLEDKSVLNQGVLSQDASVIPGSI